MRSWLRMLIQIAVLAFFGAFVIATPIPLNVTAFIAWVLSVRAMARGAAATDRGGKPWVVYATQAAGMVAIIWLAVLIPVKTVDHYKARRINLPKQSMTLDQLENPSDHGFERIDAAHLSVPASLQEKVVRFPSRNLTIGEFITAVEAQTPLRHRFHHCGNGTTILWGGDCSFGLHLRLPPAPFGG